MEIRTDTETLIKALKILSEDIQSEDGVANAAILEGAFRIEELDGQLKMCHEEWADDDTFIEKICELNGVDEDEIHGSSYGVPGIQEKVNSLVKKIGGQCLDDK